MVSRKCIFGSRKKCFYLSQGGGVRGRCVTLFFFFFEDFPNLYFLMSADKVTMTTYSLEHCTAYGRKRTKENKW